MKAWRLDRLGGSLTLQDLPRPEPRPGTIVLRIEASPLLSYLKAYVRGELPTYTAPRHPFTPGTNAVGTIEAVGRDVWHLKPGQRVVFSPHLVAGENVDDPAQVLIGLTAFGAGSAAVQADWPDGTLAQYAAAPVAAITPAEGVEAIPSAQLAVLNRFIVPYGGLTRGRLCPGETVVVTGATGAYGTAAVLLALAMGAGRVVAAGRGSSRLEAVVRCGGPRVVSVRLTGDVQADAAALREAAGRGADLAFDMVGQAGDANATLAALNSLGRGGRLVLMGSMKVPLTFSYSDIMRNNWEIIGQFMYPADAYRRLIGLVRAGLLNVAPIRPHCFPLEALEEAMDAAATAGNLECIVVQP
jgi:alcohol dehydrogenase